MALHYIYLQYENRTYHCLELYILRTCKSEMHLQQSILHDDSKTYLNYIKLGNSMMSHNTRCRL